MARQKMIFFTAGPVATTQEAADIAKIEQLLVENKIELAVFAATASPNYGPNIAEADYTIGAVPESYDSEGTEVDMTTLPAPVLDTSQAMIRDVSEVPIKNSAESVTKNAVATKAADGSVDEIKLPATVAMVESGVVGVAATGSGTTVTLTVEGGVITAIALS